MSCSFLPIRTVDMADLLPSTIWWQAPCDSLSPYRVLIQPLFFSWDPLKGPSKSPRVPRATRSLSTSCDPFRPFSYSFIFPFVYLRKYPSSSASLCKGKPLETLPCLWGINHSWSLLFLFCSRICSLYDRSSSVCTPLLKQPLTV